MYEIRPGDLLSFKERGTAKALVLKVEAQRMELLYGTSFMFAARLTPTVIRGEYKGRVITRTIHNVFAHHPDDLLRLYRLKWEAPLYEILP